MKGRIKVTAWMDNYAPSMVQIRPLRDDLAKTLTCWVAYRGGTIDPRMTELLNEDDAFGVSYFDQTEKRTINEGSFIPYRYIEDVLNGWCVTFLMDPWELAAIYGYDAADQLKYVGGKYRWPNQLKNEYVLWMDKLEANGWKND